MNLNQVVCQRKAFANEDHLERRFVRCSIVLHVRAE